MHSEYYIYRVYNILKLCTIYRLVFDVPYMAIDLQSQGDSLYYIDYTIINKFVACYWRRRTADVFECRRIYNSARVKK